MSEAASLTIGDTARELGVSVDTIRRWEREGKITATRTLGGQRRFSTAEINRVKAQAA
jgi:putative resolvase